MVLPSYSHPRPLALSLPLPLPGKQAFAIDVNHEEYGNLNVPEAPIFALDRVEYVAGVSCTLFRDRLLRLAPKVSTCQSRIRLSFALAFEATLNPDLSASLHT